MSYIGTHRAKSEHEGVRVIYRALARRSAQAWRWSDLEHPVRPRPIAGKPAGSATNAAWRREQLITSVEELAALVGPWRRLVAQAAGANIFYEPSLALAAARAYGMDGAWLGVWSGGDLVGLFPMRPLRIAGVTLPLTSLSRHMHATLCVPLVHRDHVDGAFDAYIAHVTARGARPHIMAFPTMASGGAVAEALRRALARWGGVSREFAAHRRACLHTTLIGDAYLAQSLGGKRLKETRRLWRRLSERGTLAFELLEPGAASREAFQALLELEQASWKGSRGTAIAQSSACAAFFDDVINAGATTRCSRIARLTLDGRTIAATLIVGEGRTGYLWKIAHDMSLAQFSPGVLLVLELTRHVLNERVFETMDSCAVADHPMIDKIWRERIAIADRLAVIGVGRRASALVFALERGRRVLRECAKTLFNRYRNWRQI